jgi:hypothetical protein
MANVEGLYCKRPIQCLASSEILTPYPLIARRVCAPPPLRRCYLKLFSPYKSLGSVMFSNLHTLPDEKEKNNENVILNILLYDMRVFWFNKNHKYDNSTHMKLVLIRKTETTFHHCWRVKSSLKLVWMESTSTSPRNSRIGHSLKWRCCLLV